VWLFILSVFHLDCDSVHITVPSPSWLSVLRQCFPDISFFIGCTPLDIPLPSDDTWLFLHGSPAWVDQLLPCILQSRCIISYSYTPSVPSSSLLVAIDSAAAGSVVKGQWFFQVPSQFAVPPPDMYARHLSHILDPTSKYASSRSQVTRPSLSVDDAVEIARLHDPVQCCSVFRPGQWVHRPLSAVELGRVFDIPPPIGQQFASVTPRALPWLHSPPLKVLHHVGGFAFRWGNDRNHQVSEASKSKFISEAPKVVASEESVEEVMVVDGNLQAASANLQATSAVVVDGNLQAAEESELRDESTEFKGMEAGPVGVGHNSPSPSPPVSSPPDPEPLPHNVMHLSTAELEVWQQQFAKSVKADDAATPFHLWDTRVWSIGVKPSQVEKFKERFQCCPSTLLRKFLLRRWRRNVYRSFRQYLANEYDAECFRDTSATPALQADCRAGRECLWHAMEAVWWEWTMGSRLFFWRLPQAHREAVRDGYPPYFQGTPPSYRRPQPFERDANVRAKVREKLSTVRKKGYITKGSVKSLTSYFAVPKGEHDVRMVYDASKSNLNKSLWAPNFGLPTVEALTRSVDETCWMGDLDIGEMFLNFCLHPDLQPFCGVDVKPYFPKEVHSDSSLWEVWVRCMMGLKPSPYRCIKTLLLALEIIRGDKADSANPFHWDRIEFNLPGDPNYDPSRPRITRLWPDALFSALILCYVDDM
jgi:hypothetical protein